MSDDRHEDAGDERRFDFGKNWTRFLHVLDDERIDAAVASLRSLLGADLTGKAFVDVGSGSGLSSLAAHRLGAERIHSFDYDGGSVACTAELRRRYAPATSAWTVERGDVLDRAYLARLDHFDVVYSWGVLHHTGCLWQALENVGRLVSPDGLLALALYRDQGLESRFWLAVKRIYNRNSLGRAAVIGVFVPAFFVRSGLVDLARRRNPIARYREYKQERGMSVFHDWLDWLGGLPFEVASATEVLAFFESRGFASVRMKRGTGSVRNHEYVFRRAPRADSGPSRSQS